MSPISRRQFLKMAGVSALGATALGACQFSRAELLAQSPHLGPEDMVTGTDNWYATLCPTCPAGCGLVVRVVEGRAVKAEGNPLYPINEGKLCAGGQASVQELYHPDRLLHPLRRDRATGTLSEISWEEALGEVSARLAAARDSGQAGSVVLATEPLRGHQALVARRFTEAYGGRLLAYESLEDTVLRASVKQTLGQEVVPDWDIASARYILSFGADFLSQWVSPVRYSRGYGEFRQGVAGRGTLVHVEPRFSLTAANADQWLPVRPGQEGRLALSMAQVIVSEGLGDAGAGRAIYGQMDLDQYRPEAVAQDTGIGAERIRSVARAFAAPASEPGVALAGGSVAAQANGLAAMNAVLALNYLVGNLGRTGGVALNPPVPLPEAGPLPASPFEEWQRLAGEPPSVLLVHKANPVYGMPGSLEFAGALDAVPFIVSFTSFLDDTSTKADIILPLPAGLEDWGDDVPDPGPGRPVVGLQQPVIFPLGDTKGFGDVLLELGRRLALGLPWNSFKEALQEGARALREKDSMGLPDGPAFWNALLQQGGWWSAPEEVPAGPPPQAGPVAEPSFAGDPERYPYHLIPFPSHSLGDGRGAHLPWLQATPDPLTTVAWQTWIEVNANVARELGLAEGDVVEVTSPNGTLEAPVYPHPMMPPWAVAIPVGQGHRAGPYAQGQGANPLSIVAPLRAGETGALAWAATRVQLRKTGRRVEVTKFEGSVPALQLPESEIVRVSPSPTPLPSRERE